MQLTRIHLAQFRKFRDAIDIPDLAPGLNLFTGPNEAGKSTIAAAIRAAFFERHRSNAAEDFRPDGDTGATPAITLEFLAGGKSYRLFKQFLARKRCSLEFDGRRLDGDEAEDYLAGLMGYQYAGKGRSKAEHWGIPGLLWAEQGRSQELDLAISYAVDHLRAALGAASGHQTEDTDQVVAAVTQQRNALLTPSSGAPRLAYAEALAKVDTLSAELADIQREAQAYRQAVDRLAELKSAHDRDEAEQPWLAIRTQQQQAQQQLQATQQLSQSLQAILARQHQLRETASLLQNQLQHLAAQAHTLESRRDAVEQARLTLQQAQAAAERWQQSHRQAGESLSRTLAALERSRKLALHSSLRQQALASQQRLEQAQAQLARADAAEQAWQALQSGLATLRVNDKDLNRLRDLGRRRRELQIRQQANATRLQFALQDQATILLGDDALRGDGERLLTADASLQLPGLGVLHIRPGGDSLDALRQEGAELDAAWNALLASLNAASLEDIETRHAQAAQRQADAALQRQTLSLHAPDGIDALRGEIATLLAQQNDLQQQLARAAVQSAPADNADADADADAIQDAHRAAQQAADHAREQWHQAQLAVGAAQAQYEHSNRELLAAQAATNDPQQAEQRAQWQRRLVDTNAELAQADSQAEALRRDIAQARPDILAQDVERLRRSADQLLQAHRQRHETLLRLDAELQALGARGLDERAAVQAQALAQAQRSADELARRAGALDHLLTLLRTKQQDATQALQAPLQARLRHYLDLLFPGAELLLDDRLVPGTLRRPGDHALRADLLNTLSHGAREQLGVIGRLACADLLQEAGRPTLLILDDALVHTDTARLAQMKRILFDAATRHQILLFSCHDTLWRDLGIAPRDVGTLAAATQAAAA